MDSTTCAPKTSGKIATQPTTTTTKERPCRYVHENDPGGPAFCVAVEVATVKLGKKYGQKASTVKMTEIYTHFSW